MEGGLTYFHGGDHGPREEIKRSQPRSIDETLRIVETKYLAVGRRKERETYSFTSEGRGEI